jgi:hypothetical protein
VLPAIVALLAAAVGAAGAIQLSGRDDSHTTTFAAAPPPLAAAPRKAHRPATKGRATPIEWPADVRGWTVVLVSLPRADGADAAAQRAQRAVDVGLPEAGYLVSDRFASLHPGYFVIFTGVYPTRAEAEAAVPTARSRGFGGAYARPVVP